MISASHYIDTDDGFGVIRICIPDTSKPTCNTLNLQIGLDNSGSMDEVCSDGKTQIDHARHTLKNTVKYLHEIAQKGTRINLSIFVFDHEIQNICSNIDVEDKTIITNLLKNINEIESRGSTDIEAALRCQRDFVSHHETLNNDDRVVCITLTDGQPTCGNCDDDYLAHIPSDKAYQYYIGYGPHHHYKLLSLLGANRNSEYYFAESFEKSGMVYGEIVHRILYSVIDQPMINIVDGIVYDSASGEWKSNTCLSGVSAGDVKTVALKATQQDSVIVKLVFASGESILSSRNMYLEDDSKSSLSNEGIFRARIRQDVIDFMHKCTNCLESEKKNIIEQGTQLLNRLRSLLQEDGWKGDSYLRQLCDDVYIAKKALLQERGGMYLGARLSAQSQQRAYNVSLAGLTPAAPSRHPMSFPPLKGKSGLLKRRGKSSNFIKPIEGDWSPPEMISPTISESDDYDDDDYVIADQQSCFASPAVAKTMDYMSRPD